MPTSAKQVNVHEAKTTLSRLLEQVAAGETIVIAKAGRPVAQLSPIPQVDLMFGSMKGLIICDEDEFLGSDPDMLAMFDADLELDVPR